MEKPFIAKAFLMFLIVGVLYLCYLIFAPFLPIIIAATMLVAIFHGVYERLVRFLRGRRNIAAVIMCLLIALLVIIPLVYFFVYTAGRSVEAYQTTVNYFNSHDVSGLVKSRFWEKYSYLGINGENIKTTLLDFAKNINGWLVASAGNLIAGTTTFVFSLFMIFFTMYFFFVDGQKMLQRVMFLTPLSNKYDREIFKKFRDVSFSTIVSTFATAIAQGVIGSIGFMIVGFPGFFAGLVMGFFSLMPYVGTGIIWFPTAIYLFAIGKIWQGFFMLFWGMAVISTVDNLIRAYIIRGKAEVHPIFVIFSLLGGISLFGFWGILFGPLVISLAVTIMHIYEMEYKEVLEG